MGKFLVLSLTDHEEYILSRIMEIIAAEPGFDHIVTSHPCNAYLDLAEMRAEEQVPMTMDDWAEQFEGILRLSKKEILTHAGSISAKIAEAHALSEFEKYRVKQDRLYQSDFDRILLEEQNENK